MPVARSNSPLVVGGLLSFLIFILYSGRKDVPDGYVRQISDRAKALGYSSSLTLKEGRGDPVIVLADDVPQTAYRAGSAGFNVFDNLYISETSYVAVAEELEYIPKPKAVVGEGGITFRRIATEEAPSDFGEVVTRLPGTTFIFNDPPGPEGYMTWHHNFVAEVFTGGWKALSLAPPLSGYKDEHGSLPELPSRWMLPKCNDTASWMDEKNLNVQFLASVSPDAPIEEEHSWKLRSMAGQTVVMDRAVIVDRRAAHTAGGLIDKWGKMNAAIAFEPSRLDFLDPLRESVISVTRAEIEPVIKPVVVYLDGQSEGRRLEQSSHLGLVESLKSLTDVAEVHVASVKRMERRARIELLSRATLIIAVHHENLMESMWMPATHASAVLEIFDEGGFSPDWFLFTTLLGHHHYSIHNDHVLASPDQRVHTPGFDGPNLKVNGEFVVELVRDILANPLGQNK